MQPIETPRLILRPLTAADAPALFEILRDAEVCRWQPFSPLETLKQAQECIEEMTLELEEAEKTAEEFRFGIYAKEEQAIVGQLGIELDPACAAYELGVTLGRGVWGKGYASEAVRALLNFAHEKYGFSDFFGVIAAENTASRRMATRCGFAFERACSFQTADGHTVEAARYTLHID